MANRAAPSVCFKCEFEGHWLSNCPCAALANEREDIRLFRFCGLSDAEYALLDLDPVRDLDVGVDFPADVGGRGGPAYLRWCLAHSEVEFVALLAKALGSHMPRFSYHRLVPYDAVDPPAEGKMATELIAVDGVGGSVEWEKESLSEWLGRRGVPFPWPGRDLGPAEWAGGPP